MNDSLKQFISQNRDRFDDKEPSEKVWYTIQARIDKTTSLWNSVVLWRSAAILLLSLSTFLFFSPIGRESKKEQAAIRVEFKDLEAYYSNQIYEKKELVTQFQAETGLTEDEVTQNIQKLEAMYQVLLKEMEKRATIDVKDALVLNLLVRIDLLNQQLNKLDKRNDFLEDKKVISS
jgi:hypothetical protein